MAKSEDEKLEQRAKNILLFQLSRSMKTRHQLAEVLKRREIPTEIANAVLDRFTEAQLIDDAAFTSAFVRSRLEAGRSAMAIRQDLTRKGVAKDLIFSAVGQIDQEQEQEIADRLAVSKYQRMLKLEPEVRQRRLLGFLQRRGFSQAIAHRAIRKASSQG